LLPVEAATFMQFIGIVEMAVGAAILTSFTRIAAPSSMLTPWLQTAFNTLRRLPCARFPERVPNGSHR